MMSKPSQEEELEALRGGGSSAWISGGHSDSVRSRRGMFATVAGAEHIPEVSALLSVFLMYSILRGGEGRFMECAFEGVADLCREAMVSWREGKTKESSRGIASDALRRRGVRELEEELSSLGNLFVEVSLG